jgi:glyoxylase-like metal-dependent hydrolase (beta-lactamase superfamily II)
VDPGDEPDRIFSELSTWGLGVRAILVTHGHFDHLGAVGPIARQTEKSVYMPRLEADRLTRLAEETPEGFGPFESYVPTHLLDGGEHLDLDEFGVDVLEVPGHTEGHLAYLVDGVLCAGDVLFRGSVGRTDLPGGDWEALATTLRSLAATLAPETLVLPGHGPETTLAAELAANPFVAQALGRA